MTDFAFRTSAHFAAAEPLRDQPFAVAGVCWDGATTHRPGARMAPAAIRRASRMLCDATHPHFDLSPAGQLGDAGDLALPNTALAAMRAALQSQAAALIARHHMAWLGGDHSITLALLRAYRVQSGRPLALLHFDAHCDTWSDHFGAPSGHGTWLREALDEGLVDGAHCVQIGIRSAAERATRELVARRGGLIFDARSLRGLDSPAALDAIAGPIRDRLAAADAPPAYLSLDIDCLDPAFAPGTGTPEPAGLSTAQVATLLEALAPALPFIGMDCVEVSPPFDHAEMASQAAAHFVWTYLCARIAARGQRARA